MFRHLLFALLALSLLASSSCADQELPVSVSDPQPAPVVDAPDAYRDKIRTQPYPKASNELMLNPAPLIVPQSMKTGEALEFSLSRSENFDTPETMISTPQAKKALAQAQPRTTMMRLVLFPLKKGNVSMTMVQSSFISWVKRNSTNLFARLKANR